jgi:nucleoside-diphosphate-sugar epimerase
MRVLVTGADGFIGRAICQELENIGTEVIRLIRNKPTGVRHTNGKNIVIADITDSSSLRQFENLQNIDALVHTAGLAHQFGNIAEENFLKVNVLGTKNIAELALKINVRHFIQISSVSVYGNVKNTSARGEIDETYICRAVDPYGLSKLESEKICQDIFSGQDICLTVLRLATVIGEEDPGNVLRLIRAIDQGRFLWVGSGENRKSLIYRKDVARAIAHLLDETKLPELKRENIYNLSARPYTMKQIVKSISVVLNKKVLPLKIPLRPIEILLGLAFRLTRLKKVKKYQKTLNKWVSDECFTGKKFRDAYDFKESVEPAEALGREVNWYLGLKK